MLNFLRRNRRGDAAVLAVIGMHRSGTSCLAGTLQQRGLFLGEVSESNANNPKGNRENARVIQLNDDVLENSDGAWHRPPESLRWTRAHRRVRDQIIEDFDAGGHQSWGFKDPRTLLTLPFWREALPDLAFAGTFRHPLLVVASLQKRNNMPTEIALGLWRAYNLLLLEIIGQNDWPLLSFDVPASVYELDVRRAITTLGIAGIDPVADSAFLDKSLVHQSAHDAESLPREIEGLLEELQHVYAGQTGN